MQGMNRNFILNTIAALIYNGLAGLLVMSKPLQAYYYTAGLFLVTGVHLILLFFSAFKKIRKLLPVGFTGFSILAVLLIHVIFWLLFINIP